MAQNNVKPNVSTLNAVLEALFFMFTWRPCMNISLKVIKEFEELGIEPSLASYYYLLRIWGRARMYLVHNNKFRLLIFFL